MKLTDEQLKSVAAWFAAGASPDEIQKRLVAEYGVHITYFDLRMIVAELPQPEETEAGGREDKTNKTPKTPRTEPLGMDSGTEEPLGVDDGSGEPIDEAQDSNEAQAVSAPTVTIDALMLPASAICQKATAHRPQTPPFSSSS